MKTDFTYVLQKLEEYRELIVQNREHFPDYIDVDKLISAYEALHNPDLAIQMEKELEEFISTVQRAYSFYYACDRSPDFMKSDHKKTEELFQLFFSEASTLPQVFWTFLAEHSRDIALLRLYNLEQAREQYQSWLHMHVQNKTQFRKKARQMKRVLDEFIGFIS